MPEESFEQQARRITEKFGMEPAPDVWQRVEAAIAPQRRRRRTLLWWWLLPLCLGGTVAVVLVAKSRLPLKNEVAISVAADKKASLQKEELSAVPKQNIAKEKKETVVSNKEEKYPDKVFRNDEKNVPDKKYFVEKKITGDREGIIVLSGSFVKRRNERPMISKEISNQLNRVDAGVNRNKKEERIIEKQSGPFTDSASDHSVVMSADSAGKKSKTGPDILALITKDSVPENTVVSKETKQKKAKKKSWQTGVVAEMGIATWGKGLFTDESKFTGNYADIPSGNTSGNDGTVVSRSINSLQIKNGADVALGIAVRRPVFNRFYISAQAGYRYQQYRLYQFINIYSPGPVQSNTLSNYTSYLVRSDQYHSHFLNLNTAIGTILFGRSKTAFSVELGVDNSFLFSIKQRSSYQFSSFSGNLSGNFYRWQPQVVLSLPFDWRRNDKVILSLSPFARFGFRDFEKNSMITSNNHLLSSGIQAVYFFK